MLTFICLLLFTYVVVRIVLRVVIIVRFMPKATLKDLMYQSKGVFTDGLFNFQDLKNDFLCATASAAEVNLVKVPSEALMSKLSTTINNILKSWEEGYSTSEFHKRTGINSVVALALITTDESFDMIDCLPRNVTDLDKRLLVNAFQTVGNKHMKLYNDLHTKDGEKDITLDDILYVIIIQAFESSPIFRDIDKGMLRVKLYS